MNRRKEPSGLQDMVYWKIGEMVWNVGLKWTRRLYAAAVRGRSTWLQEIQSVEAECVLLHQEIDSLPLPIISELLNRYTIEDFTQIVECYDKNNGRPSNIRMLEREIHQKICESIVKSVLFPCIRIWNLSNMESENVEELLIKLIYITPNTEILILPEIEKLSYKQLFVQNIHILNHLQQFVYHIGCTTEIIVELSKYCPHLKNISVENSKRVDNKCVDHLLKLRHLQNLNIAGTSVFSSSYSALLSGLPELQDIVWFRPIHAVLIDLTGCLHSVTRFVGNIICEELLVQKCPNIIQLTLFHTLEDVSGLGELRSVSTFKIIRGSCFEMRFSIVIRRLGANLSALQVNEVRDLNINDIIDSCTVLNSLDISYCDTIEEDTLEGNLAHFQNLKKIKLVLISGPFDLRPILHKYANLNEFHVEYMSVMNESFIRQIVMAGRFTHLTKFVVDKCGDMSIDIARLLIHNCPNLTELGNIYTWSGVRFDEIETFSNFVRDNNLSLTFLR